MVIGVTGNGKSAFLSEYLGLEGGDCFASSVNPESETMSTCTKKLRRGGVEYVGVDTPGFDDCQDRDDAHIIDMCRALRELEGA
jgi:predicted GTPase